MSKHKRNRDEVEECYQKPVVGIGSTITVDNETLTVVGFQGRIIHNELGNRVIKPMAKIRFPDNLVHLLDGSWLEAALSPPS